MIGGFLRVFGNDNGLKELFVGLTPLGHVPHT